MLKLEQKFGKKITSFLFYSHPDLLLKLSFTKTRFWDFKMTVPPNFISFLFIYLINQLWWKILLTEYTLFQIWVAWVTISDWPLLVGISFYGPQRSSGNVPEYSFGRISWNLPWHTLTERFILFVNLQTKFGLRKRLHNLVPLTLDLMYRCPLGKNPIFPH